jgi:arginine:pyruvate transaminase
MRYASVTDRLAGLGGAKWALHARARAMKNAGEEIIELTIGEPDVPTPDQFLEAAAGAMRPDAPAIPTAGANPASSRPLPPATPPAADARSARDQVMCLPGTQTTLYGVLRTLVEAGDEVLIGDPMYATYEGLIAQTGARMVPVPCGPSTASGCRPPMSPPGSPLAAASCS